MKPLASHPLYFLVRTDGQCHASLAAIQDEPTGKRFVSVFISAQDAEEFAVANALTSDNWEISEARDQDTLRDRVAMALRSSAYEVAVNPPPMMQGALRTLPIESLRDWSQTAKEPLLVWAGYETL